MWTWIGSAGDRPGLHRLTEAELLFEHVVARRFGVSPRYFPGKVGGGSSAGGDAKSLLIRLGNQLAALRPGVMGADLDVRVEQTVGEVRGRATGVRWSRTGGTATAVGPTCWTGTAPVRRW
ncbi:hypothetical protein [Saccharothrix stipae]